MGGVSGAAALMYEVGTSNVVGVSWLGENLMDMSQYNISQANPIVLLKTLNTIQSNTPMRQAIDSLGGSTLLTQPTIPLTIRDTWVGGYSVSVRNVNPGLVSVGLNLRVIVIVPMTPSLIATLAANSLAASFEKKLM